LRVACRRKRGQGWVGKGFELAACAYVLVPVVLGDSDRSGRSVRDCNDFAGSVAWKAVERVVNREGG
jgi:hypothetical protein